MTFIQIIFIFTLALFSIMDLRTRLVPLIDVVFGLTAFYAFPDNPWNVGVLVFAVMWGIFQHVPSRFAIPFIFFPISWPILLVGTGVRQQLIGRADLFAIATIGFLFPITAVIAALVGFEFWRRIWISRGKCGLLPALPGLFLGLAVYGLVQITFQYFA